MHQPDAIVLGLTATGLAVARELRPRGVRVYGIDADRSRPGVWSRQVANLPGLSRRPLDDALVGALLQHAGQKDQRAVLIPAADDAVEWLIAHREALCERFSVSQGMTEDRAGVVLDKLRFAQSAKALGMDVPLTVMPRDRADVDDFVRQAGLPCIVKPRAGHLWRKRLKGAKLLVPESREALDRALDEVVGDVQAVVLQELVPGPESEIVLGAVVVSEATGEPVHVLTARKERQFPLDFGSGALVRTERLPEIDRLSREVVTRLGYRGICGTEFKRDPRNGRYRLIEINARPTLWFDICRAAGSHVIYAHYADLAGLPAPTVQPQRDGVVWRYLSRDLIALAQRHRKPLPFLRAAVRAPLADTDAVMAVRDPATIAANLAHTAVQAFSHLIGKG